MMMKNHTATATDATAFSPLRRLARLATALVAVCALFALTASGASAAFGIKGFDGEVTVEGGGPAKQAGSHPFEATTTIEFNETTSGGLPVPDGNFKDIETRLPAGLVGNPKATHRCPLRKFLEEGLFAAGLCPDGTAVGTSTLQTTIGPFTAPVYNLVPGPGQPARFGFHILTATIFLNVSVRTGKDYGLTIEIPNSSQGLPVVGTTLALWGVPANPAHDPERGKCMTGFGPSGEECPSEAEELPFLTNPTSCTGPVSTELFVNSWQEPNNFAFEQFESHEPGPPLGTSEPVGAEGCEDLPFEPSLQVSAKPGSAASPSSLDVAIHIPQHEAVNELATAHLRKAEITLPKGFTVNASAANGLGACTEKEIEIEGPEPAQCPSASKIGTAEIVSPLLDDPLEGAVYLAKQGENKFHSLLAVYLVAEADGVLVKLPGRIDTDPASGQVTATFDEDPQLPFSDLDVSFFGGDGAVLSAPSACGTYTASGTFTPWSGTAPVTESDSFTIARGPNGGPCPNGGFAPKFSAGTTNPTGGHYSPFVLNLSREDGSQAISGVDAKLPQGLLAKLAGIPYCSDAALAAIPTAAGSGAAELASPSCPAASQVGTVAVSAGTGPAPVLVNTGKAYLAGPYKGAPLSLALVTPALAGPLDLGNVVVRAALKVNPETAQVEAVSDPIPTILSGIPLNLREVRVRLDRGQFTVNPTSCDPTAVEGTVGGSAGAVAAVSDRFQVGSCASLGLSPKLTLDLKGATRRGGFPKLRAVLTAKPGQANLRRVSVALPHSEFLAQSHIKTVCTRVQFSAGACPAGSVYGFARAFSPLLDQPLEGPVYLRSSSHKLPDLVAALHGQIEIDLAGRIDSVKGGLRDTFEAIPDAPITRFELSMKGGRKGLLENSRNICAAGSGRATVEIDGQNGRTADQRPALNAGCGKKG
jgi:hypothetical protein